MPQADLFETDNRGRMAAKLGISTENEIVLDVLDAGRDLHQAMERYQVGVVDCEMSRLGAGDRSAELKRLWAEVFGAYHRLGSVLGLWMPKREDLIAAVNDDIARERKAAEESKKLGHVEAGYQAMVKEGMPVEEPPKEPEPTKDAEPPKRGKRGPIPPVDKVDEEYRKLMGEGMPLNPPPDGSDDANREF